MTRFLILYLCLLHDVYTLTPTPDDWVRFNLPRQPAYFNGCPSPCRAAWLKSIEHTSAALVHARCGACDWCEYYEALERERVWYLIDDLFDTTADDGRRWTACRELQVRLGHWRYYEGTIPMPWKEMP